MNNKEFKKSVDKRDDLIKKLSLVKASQEISIQREETIIEYYWHIKNINEKIRSENRT